MPFVGEGERHIRHFGSRSVPAWAGDRTSTTHPLGLRPAGEGGATPALGVVVNAIVDALSEFGVDHVEMPVTPERIWRAMRSKPQLSRMALEEFEQESYGSIISR